MVCLVETGYLWLQKLNATMPGRHTSLMTTGDDLTGVVVNIFWTLGHCDMIAVVCLVTRYLVYRHSTTTIVPTTKPGTRRQVTMGKSVSVVSCSTLVASSMRNGW